MNTKLQAYIEIQKSGTLSRTQAEVLDCLLDSPKPLSRADIADQIGRRISSICGRSSDLLKAGLIEVAGTGTDPLTGKKVQLLRAVEILKGAV